MRKGDIWGSVLLLAIGSAVCYGSARLGVGSWTVPGPGFLPFGAGLVLTLLSLAVLILTLTRKEAALRQTTQFWSQPDSYKTLLLLLVSLVAYNIIWVRLGYTLTTVLYMGFLFRFVGKRSWGVSVGGAAVTSVLTYALFQLFLQAQLPTGILGF
jgi:succinate dehydrogenase hydrophobic anchor subunit